MVDDYSHRLKLAMKEASVTTPRLAKELGVSFQAVRKAENGGNFTAENNVKAARFLKVNSDWLATGQGPMRATDAHAPGTTFHLQALRPEQRELLENFSLMLEDDQREFAMEIAARAAKMRAHNSKVLQQAAEQSAPEPASDTQSSAEPQTHIFGVGGKPGPPARGKRAA